MCCTFEKNVSRSRDPYVQVRHACNEGHLAAVEFVKLPGAQDTTAACSGLSRSGCVLPAWCLECDPRGEVVGSAAEYGP